MKVTNRTVLSSLAIHALTLFVAGAVAFGADLAAGDKQFLSSYEKIHAALIADDLGSAKKAASDLGAGGEVIAASRSLEEARSNFAKLSEAAEKLVAGQPGYYVMHCPMVNKDWVQTSTKVANPYAGKEMLSCGEVKK